MPGKPFAGTIAANGQRACLAEPGMMEEAGLGHVPEGAGRGGPGTLMREPALCFLHIPKCAGTTVIEEILMRVFSRNEILLCYDAGTTAQIESLKKMSDRKKKRIRCLAGHFAFGIHEVLPNGGRYVTILRQPLERVISHYEHARRHAGHHLHAVAAAAGSTLLDYVRHPRSVEVRNAQTRLLAGVGWGVRSGRSGRDTLERAKENLEKHFVLAGVVERFDAFARLLQRLLGGKAHAVAMRNVSGSAERLAFVPPEILQGIAGCNDLDMQLYAHVKAAFLKRLGEGPA
jgi:hypothetical protein